MNAASECATPQGNAAAVKAPIEGPTPSLDVMTFPLEGYRLIEASAGTGKTWTLAALYLRLVLGHGGPVAFPRALLPSEILVVTFTEAATAELRDRIRARLAEAARVFAPRDAHEADEGGPPGSAGQCGAASDDPWLLGLRDHYPPSQWPALCARLTGAAQAMDESVISTIHAWCHRMLREHAVDSGSLFDAQLLAQTGPLLAEAVRDHWREHFYPLSGAAARRVSRWWADPDALCDEVVKLLPWSAPLGPSPDPRPALESQLQALEGSRAAWRGWIEEAHALLQSAIEARQVDGRRLKARDVAHWFATLRAWASGEVEDCVLSDAAWRRLTPNGLAEAWRVGTPPAHPAFEAVQTLQALQSGLQAMRSRLLHHAVQGTSARIRALKEGRGHLGFDDLLGGLDAALQGEGGGRLAERIRTRFPVALIDEFQDTDPLQWRIFDTVYGRAGGSTALVLIGDPKQSIYGFRGADIHTYLQVREDLAGRRATLRVNRRASQALVHAVNHVFDRAESRTQGQGAFLGRGSPGRHLPFEKVSAQGRDETWVRQGGAAPALTLWCLQAEGDGPPSATAYVERMSEHVAQQIVELLREGAQGLSGFRDTQGRLRGVGAGDIAVLVDQGEQARAVRQALRRRGVRSVYLSDKTSVFQSPVTGDVLRWLQACAAPQDERAVRAALASATLGLDWVDLDRLNHDEAAAQRLLQRFAGYQVRWQRQGVLPMLRQLMRDFDVHARLLAREEERELTDLLHLAEWLQQTSAVVDSPQALLRQLARQRHVDAGDAGSDELRRLRLESDAGLVKVVTVHKSKGLEYPLVFLPFAARHRAANGKDLLLRWRDDDQRLRLSLDGGEEATREADRERLAEDLRKFYVALTRARFATWVGVAPLKGVEGSALGYLLSGEGPLGPAELPEALRDLQDGCEDIAVGAPPALDGSRARGTVAPPNWRVDPPCPSVPRPLWWMACFSALSAELGEADGPMKGSSPPAEGSEGSRMPTAARVGRWDGSMAGAWPGAADSAEEDTFREGLAEAAAPEDPSAEFAQRGLLHDFPAGARAGTFLHGLLEWAGRVGFAQAASETAERDQWVARRCERQGYADWAMGLQRWLGVWLDTPWDLQALVPGAQPVRPRDLRHAVVEMEFWVPTAPAELRTLDACVRAWVWPGEPRPVLTPRRLNGLLKGFIDLVFEHEGRYFVADHKSNRLSAVNGGYGELGMRRCVLAHRYDLQYTLYLFALHRLLRARLGAAYDYERHVGGVVYLFLRGHAAPGGGLFLDRPPRALMEALDRLVSGDPRAPHPPGDPLVEAEPCPPPRQDGRPA